MGYVDTAMDVPRSENERMKIWTNVFLVTVNDHLDRFTDVCDDEELLTIQ